MSEVVSFHAVEDLSVLLIDNSVLSSSAHAHAHAHSHDTGSGHGAGTASAKNEVEEVLNALRLRGLRPAVVLLGAGAGAGAGVGSAREDAGTSLFDGVLSKPIVQEGIEHLQRLAAARALDQVLWLDKR